MNPGFKKSIKNTGNLKSNYSSNANCYKNKLPFVSIIIPTLNAQKYLELCLKSIKKQNYPADKFEILIIDGGSKDQTLKIAKKYKTKILKNPNKDPESGKSIGIQVAKGEIVALIDSDNELVEDNWLRTMVRPLVEDKNIFGVESPWYIRKNDPLINQYVTLLVIADPLARRFHPKMKIENNNEYDVFHLKTGQTPVVGANGFLWRKKIIKLIDQYKPKFEEVNYLSLMIKHGYLIYARMRYVGIYHHYCTSLRSYIKKRIKIGRKFMSRKQKGQDTWVDQSRESSFLLAVLYNVSILGPLIESCKEYKKTRNIAWFYHPLISFLTIIVYTGVYFEMKLKSFLNYEKN